MTNTPALFTPRDILRATRRLRLDMRDDWFPDPLRFRDFFQHNDRIAIEVGRQLKSDPSSSGHVLSLPKSGYTLRYGIEVPFEQRILYQACADHLAPALDQSLSPRAFAFRYHPAGRDYMFARPIDSWRQFVDTVRGELESSAANQFVLQADIYNFFETIEHNKLIAHLNTIGVSTRASRVISLLQQLLNTWSPYNGHGVPQNRDASSLLCNVYLGSVDQAMLGKGHNYFRFMDDILVVCRSAHSARRALVDLVESLRMLRLNVNSRKTRIIPRDSTVMAEALPANSNDLRALEVALASRSHRVRLQAESSLKNVLLEAVSGEDVDERRFRYSVVRLTAQMNSGSALNLTDITSRLIVLLDERPWLTDLILCYLSSVTVNNSAVEDVIRYVTDAERMVYGWQEALLLSFLGENGSRSRSLKRLAERHLIESRGRAQWAPSALVSASLGGDAARRRLARSFASIGEYRDRRACLVALQQASDRELKKYVLPHITSLEKAAMKFLRQNEPCYFAPYERLTWRDLGNDLRMLLS